MALARGGTGACNAVNTALTTDAQLQGVGESLSGALGLGEAEITGRCSPKSFTLCVPGLGLGLGTHLASVAIGTASLSLSCPTTMLLAHGNVHFPRVGACFSSLLRIDFPPRSKSQSQTGWLPHLPPFKEPLRKPHLRVGPRGGLFWSLPLGTDGWLPASFGGRPSMIGRDVRFSLSTAGLLALARLLKLESGPGWAFSEKKTELGGC